MIDYRYLEIQNPWWANPANIDLDEKIKEYSNLKFPYIPVKVLNLKSKKGAIHLITGPRQIGKSTAMKLYIKNLLKKGFNEKRILYFNCDAFSNQKEIIDLVAQFTQNNEGKFNQIFLDEVSSVEKWPYGIKWLADAGLLSKSAVFLTGSSSINIKKSGEFLPGRRNSGKDVVLLPLSFLEYFELVTKKKIPKFNLASRALIQKLFKFDSSARKHFDNFLISGGFLRNINYGLKETTNDLYLKTLKSELFKEGKKEENLREVVKKICASLSSQTSYSNIAEEAELGSKNTAIDYLNFLSDSFFLKEVKFFDIDRNKVILKKNKKFYTTDPYILLLLQGFVTASLNFKSLVSLIEKPKQIENYVATELTKKDYEYYFYQNSKELDFYIPKKDIGIEVKYKDKITSSDLKSFKKTKSKILVSKNTLELKDDILVIPAHLFGLISY